MRLSYLLKVTEEKHLKAGLGQAPWATRPPNRKAITSPPQLLASRPGSRLGLWTKSPFLGSLQDPWALTLADMTAWPQQLWP